VKRRELIRHLERFGCTLLREGARHSRYVNLADPSRSATVPRHTEIADLLARRICRQLGSRIKMNQDLRRKLDRITDILWAGGVTNPVTYIEPISYLIYLKLLDEEEAERELRARLTGGKGNGNGRLLFPKQAERYRWSKWRFKSGTDLRDFLRNEVFPYMASLVKEEPQIAEYFRDAVLEITDPNVLKQVVDELDGLDFRKLGTDVKGDIFEYLLTHLGQSALNGQFRTPARFGP
jgi:type I restriction enzyme M protein